MEIAFWSFWWATLALCAWKIIDALRNPERMMQWPFLASCMWAYFYVYIAYEAKIHFFLYVPDWDFALGQAIPLLCLAATFYGWELGMLAKPRSNRLLQPVRYLVIIWMAGMAAMLIAAWGNYSVMKTRAAVGDDFVFADTSAYWYLLFYIGYPGLALCLWSAYKMHTAPKLVCLSLSAIGALVFMLPNIINARRGPLFPTVIVFLLMPPLVKKMNPSRAIFLGSLTIAAFVMLLFVQAREWVYKEGTWSEALESMTVTDVLSHGESITDNEYVNNCHIIGTIVTTGKYEYGTGYFELLVHWIPRKYWPGKPDLGEGYYPTTELFNDIERVMGIRLLGGGASTGGVADSFVQYGFLCPVMWFLLSLMAGRTYRRARTGSDPRWQIGYVSMLCATHWLVAQGLAAAFVPAMFFQAIPALIFVVLPQKISRRRLVVSPRKVTPLKLV